MPVLLGSVTPVRQVSPVPGFVSSPVKKGFQPSGCMRDQRQDVKSQDHEGVVNRQNAEHTAQIEASKIAWLALGIEENAGNQKARKHEKQINANPSEAQS